MKMSQDTKLLVNLFLPFYLIHCTAHVYLTYGSLLQRYGFSHEATGWILSIYFLAAMASRPLAGWLIENLGFQKVLIWSGIASFIGCSLLFLFRESAEMLFIGRAIGGASFAIYATALFSYQSLCVPENKRGGMLSLLVVGGILTMATVTPLGEWFLINSQYSLYLAIGPILSLVCCILGSRVGAAETEETRASAVKPKSWGTYGGLFSSRPFLFLLITATLMSLTDTFIINISLLAAEKGLAASYFLTSSAVVAVFLRIFGSKLMNEAPRVALLAPCAILMAVSTIMIALFPTNGMFVLGGIIFGIGIGAGWPMFHALIADFLSPALRPKGTSTALLFYDGGFFVGPLIAGYFMPHFGTAGTLMAIAIATGTSLLLLEIFYWLPFYRKAEKC